jgi:hypothetical protein
MITNIEIENVFRLNDEHEIYEYCKTYAIKDPNFAEVLIKRFLPDKNNTAKSNPMDLSKEIAQCFVHIYNHRGYRDWGPELDWDAIKHDLHRLIEKGKYMLNKGLVHEVIDLSLRLLRKVCEEYGLDQVYNYPMFDCNDFCTNDVLALLKEAIADDSVTPKDKRDISESLEKISELNSYRDFFLCDFSDLIHYIKRSLLSEKDYVEYLETEMEKAEIYKKDIFAIKLFDYKLDNQHKEDAEKWANENLQYGRMMDRYVEWLILEHRQDDALLALDKGIKDHKAPYGFAFDWRRKKSEINKSIREHTKIIEQNRKLFMIEQDCIPYYHQLKKLILPEEWTEFLMKLIQHKDFGKDACSNLSQIYFEEKLYSDLFNTLDNANANLLNALEKYAKCLTEDQQTILISKIETVLISFAEHQVGRNIYKELAHRLKILKECCAVGKASTAKLVSQFRISYCNRPAMLDELSIF